MSEERIIEVEFLDEDLLEIRGCRRRAGRRGQSCQRTVDRPQAVSTRRGVVGGSTRPLRPRCGGRQAGAQAQGDSGASDLDAVADLPE